MLVLGIDTALDACSVAIAREGRTLALLSEEMQRGQAERLAPMVREAADRAGVAFAQVERVAVTAGPGSFTGVRVGLSFARALALALNKPCLGLSTLEALALQGGESGLRAALIETPGGAYLALYKDGCAIIAPRAILRGEHALLLEAAAEGRPFELATPGGGPHTVAAMAARAGRLEPALYPPNPQYLRAPHVTLPGAKA